jgi:hypothetical protein
MEMVWVVLSVLAALCAFVACMIMLLPARSNHRERDESSASERDPLVPTVVDTNLESHAPTPAERSPADSSSDGAKET